MDEQLHRGDTLLFETLIRRLLEGQTVGWAMTSFAPRFAAALSKAGNELLELFGALRSVSETGDLPQLRELISELQGVLMSPELDDIRKYVIIGDPAARLPIE
jgi:hypothetical protein